jgi:hypothetical protein
MTYFEETILRAPSDRTVTPELIEKVFAEHRLKIPKPDVKASGADG